LPQPRFQKAALGGTFDHIHRGHRQLLAKAFNVARDAVIGLTTNSLVKKEGKIGIKSYAIRKRQLEEYLNKNYPRRSYAIRPLRQPLGEIGNRRDIDVVVVSEETFQRAVDANFLRLQNRLKPLAVYVVPMEKAEDMQRISSSRIRAGEINEEGKLTKNQIRPRSAKRRIQSKRSKRTV
jgi:pantetheine-phosphate adenylyltransferase